MNDIVRFGVLIGVITLAILIIGSVLQNTFNPSESKKTLCAGMIGHLNWLSLFHIRTNGLKADYNQQCLVAVKWGYNASAMNVRKFLRITIINIENSLWLTVCGYRYIDIGLDMNNST